MQAPLKSHPLRILQTLGLYLALNVGTFLMLKTIAQYTALDDQVGFLRAKQGYLHLPIWKGAFYIHVFSSILTLLAGFTQFSSELLLKHRRLHRLFGRIYVWAILIINFPAGLIMAVYANGQLPSKIAFFILDVLWFWFTLKAVIEIKKGNLAGHRDYMTRSYALTLSAVTLRTWKLVLSSSLNIRPELLYMIDAWLGFVPNWLCAEWLIYRRRRDRLPAKDAGDGRRQPDHHQDGAQAHQES